MPLYPISYMLVHWHGYITVLAFAGTDGLFLGFSTYLATLLNAIQQDCQDILSSKTDKNDSHNDSEEQVYSALKDIVKRHNEISKLSDECSQVMVEITLCQFITSSIIIAMCIVDILLVSSPYSIRIQIVFFFLMLFRKFSSLAMASYSMLFTLVQCLQKSFSIVWVDTL